MPHEKALPHNAEAERAVLGSLMIEPERWLEVCDDLAPEAFYRVAHATIYQAMGRLAVKGRPFDSIMLADDLRRAGELEAIGGPVYLASLVDGVPRGANVAHYAAIVVGAATLRALAHVGVEIHQSALAEGDDPALLVERALEKVSALATKVSGPAGVVSARVLADEIAVLVQRLHDQKSLCSGLPTGLPDLDGPTRGLHPGQLVIVAARPGEGKSTFALQVAANAAKVSEGAVLFCSLEMTREELGVRLLSSGSGVSGHRIQSGYVNCNEWGGVIEALGKMAETHLWIDDRATQTVASVRMQARQLKARHGLSLVVVDYVQLVTPECRRKDSNREQEVAGIARALKLLAKDLSVAVLAVSQLNRASDKGQRRPRLSDLRESGALEQDADSVWFLHPLKKKDEDSEESSIVEVCIDKQRQGPCCVVKVVYQKDRYRFESLATF